MWRLLDGEARAFPSSTSASTAPSSDGTLLATTMGGDVEIASALDGRVLASIDRAQFGTTILPGGWTYTATGVPQWLGNTLSVVAAIGHSAVWDLTTETRPAREVHRLVNERVPWRVVDGRLVPRHGRIAGKIKGGGHTQVVAKLLPKNLPHETETDADGNFMVDDLPLGAYVITANGATATATVTGFDTVTVELSAAGRVP